MKQKQADFSRKYSETNPLKNLDWNVTDERDLIWTSLALFRASLHWEHGANGHPPPPKCCTNLHIMYNLLVGGTFTVRFQRSFCIGCTLCPLYGVEKCPLLKAWKCGKIDQGQVICLLYKGSPLVFWRACYQLEVLLWYSIVVCTFYEHSCSKTR